MHLLLFNPEMNIFLHHYFIFKTPFLKADTMYHHSSGNQPFHQIVHLFSAKNVNSWDRI
jgi:hypothetical protein